MRAPRIPAVSASRAGASAASGSEAPPALLPRESTSTRAATASTTTIASRVRAARAARRSFEARSWAAADARGLTSRRAPMAVAAQPATKVARTAPSVRESTVTGTPGKTWTPTRVMSAQATTSPAGAERASSTAGSLRARRAIEERERPLNSAMARSGARSSLLDEATPYSTRRARRTSSSEMTAVVSAIWCSSEATVEKLVLRPLVATTLGTKEDATVGVHGAGDCGRVRGSDRARMERNLSEVERRQDGAGVGAASFS